MKTQEHEMSLQEIRQLEQTNKDLELKLRRTVVVFYFM